MANNIVDQIGNNVNVWTADGNAMEQRELLTLDTYGLVVTGYNAADKAVFVPWNQVRYVDYPTEGSKETSGEGHSAIGFVSPRTDPYKAIGD